MCLSYHDSGGIAIPKIGYTGYDGEERFLTTFE